MISGVRYSHTNVIARDWRSLAAFYESLFGCVPVPPERDYSGPQLEAGAGVKGAAVAGVHLRLPGHGPDGPAIEMSGGPGTVSARFALDVMEVVFATPAAAVPTPDKASGTMATAAKPTASNTPGVASQ